MSDSKTECYLQNLNRYMQLQELNTDRIYVKYVVMTIYSPCYDGLYLIRNVILTYERITSKLVNNINISYRLSGYRETHDE